MKVIVKHKLRVIFAEAEGVTGVGSCDIKACASDSVLAVIVEVD